MSESQWTVSTLKEYLDRVLAERDKALDRAMAANDKRLDGMNELKQAMSDQASKFMTRNEAIGVVMMLIALIGLVYSLGRK